MVVERIVGLKDSTFEGLCKKIQQNKGHYETIGKISHNACSISSNSSVPSPLQEARMEYSAVVVYTTTF